ncbi:MAG: regulatory protein RecX [Clostridiaceae bacterium]|nr:regulatory protein RecX [Clostridiaceae bacterium]
MEDSRKKALNVAANVLTYKNRSAQALYDRLIEKEIEAEDAAYAVSRLKELGFLNDEEYGRSLVRQCRAKGWGKSRIKQELKKKQLEPELSEFLLEDFEPDYEKMKKLIASKLKDGRYDRDAVRRTADSLMRRGFGWEQVKRALSEYIDQLEETE